MEFPDNIWAALTNIDPTWLTFAFIFIALDVLTGLAKGAASAKNGGGLSSEKMKTGFWHKLGIIAALVVAGLLDAAAGAGLDLGFDAPIFEAACGYVVIMELLSILENISELNPELAGSKLFQLFAINGEDKLVAIMPSDITAEELEEPKEED